MIRILRGMPAGVLGLEAIDDAEEEDYRNVVLPAFEAAIAEHGKLRLVADLEAAKRWAADSSDRGAGPR